MLLRNYKDKMLIETVKKMTKFFKEYIENCNTIECSLEKIKDIIKIKEEQNKILLEIANNIIEKKDAR